MVGRARIPPVLAARVHRVLVAASAFVLVVTGSAYGFLHDFTAGITTTDVAAGGSGGEQNILLVGVDSRTDARGEPLPEEVLRELRAGSEPGVLNTDAIMLLHLPEDGGAGVAFSIPRDSYVAIPDHGVDKINSAYPATKARATEQLVAEGEDRDDPAVVDAEAARQGRSALIRTVEDLTGVEIDHYAEVNLLGFYNLTRAIGGVEVCLTAPVTEQLSGARFPAGRQTISGGDALAFVRQRHGLPEGDLSRIRRQQVFLAAVADKVLSAGTLRDPTMLGRLVDVVQQSLVVDEDWDVLEFARQAADIAAGDLEFVTIPTKGSQANDHGDVVVVDSFEVRRFVEQRITALDERPDDGEGEGEGVPAVAPPASSVVDVRNASGVPGVAARVADRMRAAGFGDGAVGNTTAAERSTVRHPGTDVEGARSVARQLGGLAVTRDDAVTAGHVEVVLGRDFDQSVLAAALPAPASGPARPVTDQISAAAVPCIA